MYPDGMPILVVDSDPRRREFAERVLSDEGFAVTAVAEGFSAIRAAGAARFALAVAAVQLPGALDGVATVRRIRARQPGLKALFTGAAAACPTEATGERNEFITAPFVRRDLIGCVFELLQRGPLLQPEACGLGRAG